MATFPLKVLSASIIAAAIASELHVALGQIGPENLQRALKAYEDSAEELGATGSSLERGQAITALSTVASLRYAGARDQWAGDRSKDVRAALLDAISRMGDDTPEARAIIVESVNSDDTGILTRALRAVGQLKLRLDFRLVWRPDSALTVWSQYDRGFGAPLQQVDGIGAVRPWKDPAWKDLSRSARLDLLARAGSREALILLAEALETPDERMPRRWRSWVPAEVVDLASLREMLDHPRPEISTLASFSLVLANDVEHRSRIERCLAGAPNNSGSAAECSASVMDDQVLGAAVPYLDREALLALGRRDGGKWSWEVWTELSGRGEFPAYEEIRPLLSGLQVRRDYSPSQPYTDAERAAAIHADAVKSTLLRAIVRERRYEALDPLLERALRQPHPFRDLCDLNDVLWAAPAFLAGLPAATAHQCFIRLKAWIGHRKPERYVPHYDETGITEALRTSGMLARGDDYEQLWRDLVSSEDPLEDFQRLIPVMWGFTQRSEAMRHLLASAQGQGWFHGGDNFYDLLAGTEPDPPPSDSCAGKLHTPSWDPLGAPSGTLSFRALRKRLASDLEEIYPTQDTAALSRDFLELRGLGKRIRDPIDALELLWDPREAVRCAAGHLFKGAPLHAPLAGAAPPDDRHSVSSRAWFAVLEARVKGFSLSSPALPGPAMDPEHRSYLEALLEKRRKAFFEDLKKGVHQAPISFVVCGGQPPTPALVSMPYGGFLQATPAYHDDLRSLLASPDPALRHGAAWALWLRFRDEAALRVFLEDSQDPDLTVRARALLVFATIRYPQAAPLFPALLRGSSPELRQVGLRGVQAFGIRTALRDVQSLVLDDNPAVAETAIEVMGTLRSSKNRRLLMRLLGGPDRSAWKASTALASYRTTADVDALVGRLADKAASENERRLILGVLSMITTHPFRQAVSPEFLLHPGGSLTQETVRDWQDWWSRHRREGAGERFRSSLADLVEQFVSGDDGAANLASSLLARPVPALSRYSTNQPPTTRDRESVRLWWHDARRSDPWTILLSGGVVPEQSLDLAMDIDPRRTRLQLIAPLLRDFASSDSSYASNTWHQSLVRFAGLDFGDPAAALCDAREKIVSDWLAWAKKEGWAP